MRVIGALLVMTAATLFGQGRPHDSPEIHKLFLADQCDRGEAPGCSKSASDPDTVRNDAARRARLHVLLAEGKITTGDDLHDASFIFQHGADPNDYLLAHVLAMGAVVLGEQRSKWIAAASLDRYLQAIKQPQIFGTQYVQTFFYPPKDLKGSSVPSPSVTETITTEDRKGSSTGSAVKEITETQESNVTTTPASPVTETHPTQSPYDPALVPDSIRIAFCVPPLVEQTKAVESGRSASLAIPRVRNCER